MDRVLDLVQLLEPETPPPSPDVRARQRDALVRSTRRAEGAHGRPGPPRRRRRSWIVGIAGAAAAAVVAALLVGGSSPGRPSGRGSAVLTSVRKALSGVEGDLEEVHTSGAPGSVVSWVDVATGACRTDIMLGGQHLLTLFDEHGRAVFVDYRKREWWTRGNRGVTCEPLTPRAIERGLAAGRYTDLGRGVVDGRQALKLESTSTASGPHPVAEVTTLWVDASTYLPIQATSTEHGTAHTRFTWLAATAAKIAVLHVSVPAGFAHVAAPPVETEPVP
jgi:hypothetical protein